MQLSTAPSISLLSTDRNSANPPEIAALYAQLKENAEKLAHLRDKNRELLGQIQTQRRNIAELDELHDRNQAEILQNERELTSQRRFLPLIETKNRKIDLISRENSVFDAMKTEITRYIEEIERIGEEDSAISHENRMIGIMMTQMRLYTAQIQEKEAYFLNILARFSSNEEEIQSEIDSLKEEIEGKRRKSRTKSEEFGENKRKF